MSRMRRRGVRWGDTEVMGLVIGTARAAHTVARVKRALLYHGVWAGGSSVNKCTFLCIPIFITISDIHGSQ